jgi:asparagine synthase (glutamine-hydrolysing)
MVGNFGFFTSGGVDSGIVTAIAAKLSDKPIRTFCLTYGTDETAGKKTDREYARWISEIYKTEHREEMISFSQFPQAIPELIRYIGQPYSGYVSVHFISRFAKKFVDTAFTGDWADELFGSYKVHRLPAQQPNNLPWVLRYSDVVFNDDEKKELYTKENRNGYDTLTYTKSFFHNLTAQDSVNVMLEAELKNIFPDCVYMSVYKMSQFNNLEIKTPYASPEFVDFAAKIPGHMKVTPSETKLILKKLALRYLPKEIVYRKKEGFVTPTQPLVIRLEGYIRELLSPKNLAKHGLFNTKYVMNLLDSCYKGGSEHLSYKVWNLACFQIWYESCKGK